MEIKEPAIKSEDKLQEREVQQVSDIWSLYIYALKSPVTRVKYQKRLAKFLEFIPLHQDNKTIEQKDDIRRTWKKRSHLGIQQRCKVCPISKRSGKQKGDNWSYSLIHL